MQEIRRQLEAVTLAFIAGFLGYCMRRVKTGKRVQALYALLEASSSALVGYLVFLLCQELKMSPNYTGAVVGVCGWVGASGTIRLIESQIFKRLGISLDGLATKTTGEQTAIADTTKPAA